jgi:hypothetical protein
MIVKDLIVPAAVNMAGTMLGRKGQKKLYRQYLHQTTLLHNASVTWQEIVLNNYYFAYKPVNSIQLDESTDVAGLAQLLGYVRYVYGGVN